MADYKAEAQKAHAAKVKRMGIEGTTNRREAEMTRGHYAKGGAVKHGKGHTHIQINVGKTDPMAGGMVPGPMPPMPGPMAAPPPPPRPAPPPAPPAGPPMGGPGGPMMPPGGPPMRAKGGRVHMTAGAESGEGRLQKERLAAREHKGRKA